MPEPILDIPFVAPHVLSSMEDTHVVLKITPDVNPLLAYSVAVPKTWAAAKQFGPVPGGPLATQGLGFFAASGQSGAPVIAVTVTPIPFEIPIDTWARMSLATEGWTIVSARWFPGALGLFFDIVATRVLHEIAEVRRTSVRVDGSNIFSVNCLVARKYWDDAKEIFWAAHNTFRLVSGTGMTRMEPWLAATAETPDFEVAYPISWSASPVVSPPPGVSAVDIRLLDAAQKTLLAYLQVKAEQVSQGAPPPSVESLTLAAQTKLAEAGFVPGQPLDALTEEEDPRSVAVEGWLGGFLGKGQLGHSEVNIRLGFVQHSGLTFSLSLISPTAQDDTLVCLRAWRAFEIARATLQLV